MHAKDSGGTEEKTRPKYDEDKTDSRSSGKDKIAPDGHPASHATPQKDQNSHSNLQRNASGKSVSRPSDYSAQDLSLFPDSSTHNSGISRPTKAQVTPSFQDDSFNAFVAEFNINKQSPNNSYQKPEKKDTLEAEVEKLKEQLANVSAEKAEVTSKYEKLSAICKSQRQEIQDLKQALATKSSTHSGDSSRSLPSPGSQSSTAQQVTICPKSNDLPVFLFSISLLCV